MKVLITKDYWNGYRSLTREINLEDVSVRDLAFILSEKNVASITITRSMSLDKIAKEIDYEPE